MEICIFKYFSAEDAIVASCHVVGPKTVEVATFYPAVKRCLGVKVGIVTHSRAEVGSAVERAMLGAEMGDVLVVDLCAAVRGGHVCEAGSTPCGVSRGVADGMDEAYFMKPSVCRHRHEDSVVKTGVG